MQRKSMRASVCLMAILAAGCDDGVDPEATVRTDSAGVEVVLSTGDYRPLVWRFEPEFSLGANEGEGMFGRVRQHTVQVSPDGHIFVLDTDAKRVDIYDAAGRLVTQVDSTAEVPLNVPSALVLQEDGFAIFDADRIELMRFSAAGEYLGSIRAPRQFTQGVIDSDSAALVLTQRLTDPTTDQPVLSIIRASATDTTYVIAAQIDPELEVSFSSCPVTMFLSPIFGDPPAWDAGHGMIAVAESPTHGVRLYREGKEFRRVRRDLAPEESNNQYALIAAGQGRDIALPGGRTCTIPPEEIALGSGWKDIIPSIGAITITPEGGLWLRRVDPGRRNPAVDVIDPTGDYVGTLPLGTPWPIAFLPGGRPLVLADDSLGVTHLVAYRINKEPRPVGQQ